MSQSTCLHIQDHESGPIRVVDIPWISVRIGRAAFCEVRLTSDDLADEACRLYRRGQSWHLVPVGARSKVVVAGQSVSASCPLPFDVPFQVGRHCLTLRQDRTVDPDWQMYSGPMPAHAHWSGPATKDVQSERRHAARTPTNIDAHPVADAPLKPDWRPHATARGPEPVVEPAAGPSVKERWETRWRAAGAELKARNERSSSRGEATRPTFKAGFDSVPLKEAPVPRAQPKEPAVPRAQPVPRAEPAASSSFEPPRQRTAPAPRAAATVRSRWTVPASEPEEPRLVSRDAGETPIADPEPAEDRSIDIDVVAESPDHAIAPESPVHAIAPESSDRTGTADSANDNVAADRTDRPLVDRPDRIEAFAEEIRFAEESLRTANDFPADRDTPADEESSYEFPALAPPRRTRPSRQGTSSRRRQTKEAQAPGADRATHAASRGRKNADERSDSPVTPRTVRSPRPFATNSPEPHDNAKPTPMPSARDILATHETTRKTQARRMPAARPGREAGPTLAREPDQWALPAWLAGPPAAAFVLAAGLAAGVLSWWWTRDSHAASLMTERLIAADRTGRRGPLPEGVAPPGGTWIRSTAQHLAHWAIFMSLNEPGSDPSPDDVAALSTRALAVSPLNPTARLVLAQLDRAETGASINPRGLGLSRDAVSLAWCARRLLAAGNKEGALDMYTKAIAILVRDEPFRVAMPRYSDDATVLRFLLPGEERVREVVRELLSRSEWGFPEWSTALPKNAAVLLTAARLLKEQGRNEADKLLDIVLEAPEPLERTKPAGAVAWAARAEAFAFKSRWKESEQNYRVAIELIDDETVKRSWWFNLADIERQIGDESQWQAALKAALAVSPGDEISKKATELQRANSGRTSASSLNARAN